MVNFIVNNLENTGYHLQKLHKHDQSVFTSLLLKYYGPSVALNEYHSRF